MSPRRHGPAGPFTRFARLFSAQAPTGRKHRRSRTLDARHGLRLESLESRAMLSSVPFIATLPDELASKTASLFTVHGRYGINALNGDWELGITSNTSAPPQHQSQRTSPSSGCTGRASAASSRLSIGPPSPIPRALCRTVTP
jgi:hypothetical protein